MTGFSIGEVEQITSVKAHVLRYWEEIIPSLAPHKDMGGRRLYSKRDVQTVLRLKYFIQEKKIHNRRSAKALDRRASCCRRGRLPNKRRAGFYSAAQPNPFGTVGFIPHGT
jgi:Predicted transcriptional regulators